MNEPIVMKCGCTSQSVITMIKGVKVDPPIPSCLVHDCIDIAETKPDLTGRTARCGMTCKSRMPSSFSLAFFEFRGEGSREATLKCKCGYYEVAHGKPRTSACHKFTPVGPNEFDQYYCGCRGWD